ncbi:MAG: hypothetical protein ACREA0_06340, partial [bacterium]
RRRLASGEEARSTHPAALRPRSALDLSEDIAKLPLPVKLNLGRWHNNLAGRPMEVRLKLKPGQNGTRKLLEQYGDRLVCVRYRYDRTHRRRYKTVELIVDEGPWTPRPRRNEMVAVALRFDESDLRLKVMNAGGIWRPRQRLWELPYGKVIELGLRARMVEPAPPTPNDL